MEEKKSPPVRQRPKNGYTYHFSHNESNTFLNDISTILYILKLTGLLPFHQTISNYELGPPTRLHYFYLIIAHILDKSMAVYVLLFLFSFRGAVSLMYLSEIILGIATYTTRVFVCIKNSKVFIQILNDILKVDEEIKRSFSVKISNNCGFAAKFVVLILLWESYLMTLRVMSIDEPLTVSSYFLIGIQSVQTGLSSVFIVYTSVLLRIVAVRFEYLNSIINTYTYQEQQSVLRSRTRRLHFVQAPGTIKPQPLMDNFQDDALFAFRMHNKLMRVYKVINESFSIILVLYMGYAFFMITTTTYQLFTQITQPNISSITIQISFALLILYTIILVLLSRCAGQSTDQANDMSKLLARVYGKVKEYQIIIDKFLTKSIKQEVRFTAYGFFVIDNATLFKIYSAVTTYLVILIQFKQLRETITN